MTLRTVQVPDPAPGADFGTVVPGRYLYNVTGITATLTTAGTLDALRDLSGNGNDGTYTSPSAFGAFGPPLLAGGGAWYPANAPGVPSFDAADIPHGLCDFDAPFTVAWWQLFTPGMIGSGVAWLISFDAAVFAIFQIVATVGDGTPGNGQFAVLSGGGPWVVDGQTMPGDGLPHHVALVWDMANLTLYVDGASVGWTVTGAPPFGPGPADAATLGNPDIGVGVYQDLAVIPSALSGGEIGTLYTAGASGTGGYELAVMMFGPTALYRLDAAANSGARQVLLVVAAAESVVAMVPTGFAPPVALGPYRYSWQPGISSSSLASGGQAITVAIPPLILPAGYSVASFTLDIEPTDQWSAVTVWWNDDAMMASDAFNPFVYAPGAHLFYRQVIGAT